MTTLGWLFLFFGLLIIRAVSKGRGLTEIPGDMGDLFTAAISGDMSAVTEVLSRKGEVIDIATPSSGSAVSGSAPGKGSRTPKDVEALGDWLVSQGYRVSQGPGKYGPIGRHMDNSYHYKGLALDVNWEPSGEEPFMMDRLAGQLRAQDWHVLWKVAGHYDHLHVDAGAQNSRDFAPNLVK